jgi:hypothetical protein
VSAAVDKEVMALHCRGRTAQCVSRSQNVFAPSVHHVKRVRAPAASTAGPAAWPPTAAGGQCGSRTRQRAVRVAAVAALERPVLQQPGAQLPQVGGCTQPAVMHGCTSHLHVHVP